MKNLSAPRGLRPRPYTRRHRVRRKSSPAASNRQMPGPMLIPSPNRFAIGAKVTIRGGGTTQVREIRSGGSFLSQNDLRAYFGLGDYAGPVDVEIRMPGGRRWQWRGLGGDRLHVLELSDAASVPKAGVGR